jgi:hypothetical protein
MSNKKPENLKIVIETRGSFGGREITKIFLGKENHWKHSLIDVGTDEVGALNSAGKMTPEQASKMIELISKISLPVDWSGSTDIFDASTFSISVSSGHFKFTTGWYGLSPAPLFDELIDMVDSIVTQNSSPFTEKILGR